MRYAILAISVIGTAAAAACGGSTEDYAPAHPYTSDSGAGDDGGGVGAGTGGFSGLPCDVQKVLEDGCIACHGGTQAPRLLTYGDLTAMSPQYAGQTIAQRSLARMTSTSAPMPPPPAVAPTPQEITTFTNWVNGGTPMGTQCTQGADAGAPPGNPYGTPTVCTSKQTWTSTDTSGSMDPGQACLACHQRQGGPRFAVGGTVYPTAHEPNNCLGVAGGLTVVITDANNVVTNLTVNSNGNFYGGRGITPPFSAKVVDGQGHTRVMAGKVTAGDCNSCHTEAGANGAPGRIMAP